MSLSTNSTKKHTTWISLYQSPPSPGTGCAAIPLPPSLRVAHHLFYFCCNSLHILGDFTSPVPQYGPTLSFQLGHNLLVPTLISLDLGEPVILILLRYKGASWAAVPKTPIAKDHNLSSRKDNIGPARKCASHQVPQSPPPQRLPKKQLDTRVAAPNRGHRSASSLWTHIIHGATLPSRATHPAHSTA